MYIMDCICTFQVFPLGKLRKDYQMFKRNPVFIWNWIQKYHPRNILSKRKRISEFIIDETLLKVGSEYIWIWVAIEPENKEFLALTLSKEKNMLIAERFLSGLVKVHGKHNVSTAGSTWHPLSIRFLGFEHHIHPSFEKIIIERTVQYLKDKTYGLYDYFPSRQKNCKLKHYEIG